MDEIDGKLYCSTCKIKTNHRFIKKYEESNHMYEEYDLQFLDSYFITKCLGCDNVGFFREYGDEDMVNGNGEPETDRYVYPEEPQTEKIFFKNEYVMIDFKNAPDTIVELYKQIVSCFELRHYLLAAVGLRMVIEGICNDIPIENGYTLDEHGNKKVNKKNEEIRKNSLEGRINGMDEKKVITPINASILHQIRHLGNATAHELEVPKRRTIEQALGIIEDLIRNVYEYKNIQISD